MVSEKDSKETAEKKIIAAAREVFLEKGYDGARMQEIADRAGINKALLHYYFRSKEKLFMGIFVEVISILIPRMKEAMSGPVSLKRVIEIFVDSYHEIMLENPNLPAFVVGEIHRQPELVVEMMKQKGFDINMLKFFINQQVQMGHIRPVDPVQFMVSLVGMSLFPFIGKPIIKGIMLDGDDAKMLEFLTERKEFIVEFVLKGLDYAE
ncbi:MAG: TetR/AcrR family transcriptional regulator [Marinilabiliales bacterium]|nr:MAG: TetR/AcrR family transcriptional regulator [Marinilabiliales bacterium]